MSKGFASLRGRVLSLAILMSLSGAAFAQISFVQVKSATATSGSSIAATYTNAQTAGNLNVVAVMWGDTTSTVSSVTDSKGNSYVRAAGPTTATGLTSSIYYAKNIVAGSNTVTVTFNQSASYPNVNVLEYSGLSTTNPLDVTASATGSGTTANSGSATTTSATELIVGMGNPSSVFTAAGSGFTSRIINSFGGISEDKIVSSTGSYNATATLTSGTWVMQMAAFRASNGNPAPTVTAISPTSGSTAGGTPVTITGTGFLSGATVTLGGTAATGVTVVSSTSITATTPAHAAGAVNVVVTNTDAQSGTLTNGYTYTSAGAISFVQVKSATASSGSSIAATYTSAQAAGNLNVVAVMWGDTTSTVSSVTDSKGNTYALAVGLTRGTALTSAIYYAKNIAAGSNTVTVTFNQVAAFPNVNVLEYTGLSTTSPLDVTAGATGSGTTANSGSASTTSASELIVGAGNPSSVFTAAGSGFTSRIINSFGGISEDKIVSSTGSYNATATLTSGNWVMQMAAFRASGQGGNPAPTVTAISPSSGSTAGGTPVTITGTGFLSGATVKLGGTAATGVTVVSSTSITATTPAHAAGAVNVVVTNTDAQSGTLTNGYTYSSTPTLTGMTPNQGAVGLEVTITGSNLGTSGSVTFNGKSAMVWSWGSSLIMVQVPAGATSGTVMVTAGGVPLNAGSFTVTSQIPGTATEFSYDPMGRVNQITNCTPMNCGTGQGWAMYYTYDLAGHMTVLSSYGTTLQYGIDAGGRVTQVTSGWVDSQHPATLATVDPLVGYYPTGALRKMTLAPPNGLTETTVYNNRLQPCRINVNSSSALLGNCNDAPPSGNFQDFNANFNLGSDNGNVVGFTGSGQQNFNRSYGYDSLNRIQTMSAPGDQCSGLSWTIDSWGNRTAQTATGGSCYSPSVGATAQNRLSGAPYQYDAVGNLLNDGNHTYTYDAENRVTTVDGGATATYVYDAFGKRVEKTVGGLDNEYIYDNEGHINTVFGNGVLERMYVYLNGQPLSEYFENTTYFVHSDHLGSTRLLTRLDRTVRESDDYYPFGEQIPPTGGTASTLKFTGKERDSESGLDEFGARYYSSQYARFMIPDWSAKIEPVPYSKLDNPQSLNLYSYVGNNPLSNIDTDGHACISMVNSGSGFCTRADTYKTFDDRVYGKTRFFAAASAATQELADLAVPGLGMAGTSASTRAFLESTGETLLKTNQQAVSQIESGAMTGSGPELDSKLVHMEQSVVQQSLNDLQSKDPAAYSTAISQLNGLLNGNSTTAANALSAVSGALLSTDGAYGQVLAGVRQSLGHDINFANQSDREAIGNALVQHIRQAGGCDVVGSRAHGCSQ